jgi:hypothetical protein
MRMNFARTPKSNPAAKANLGPLPKPVFHPRLSIKLMSEILVAFVVLPIVVICLVQPYLQERAARAFISAVASGYEAARTEDIRVAEEAGVMAEFEALSNTLYCEAPALVKGVDIMDVKAEMQALADAVFSRVDSPNYPDTIKAVVTEVRRDRETGKNVAMFSPFFTPCFNGAKEPTKWTLASRQAAIALAGRWDGKKSSGNTHFVMDYANPKWKTADVDNCILAPRGKVGGGWHAFFAEVKPEDRAACRTERQLAARQEAARIQLAKASNTETKTLAKAPKKAPAKVTPPKTDDVAMLINKS